jgi:SAM-dependent methyltransferase
VKYQRLASALLLLGGLAVVLGGQSAALAGDKAVKLKLQLPADATDGKVNIDGKNVKGEGAEREVTVTPKGDTVLVKYTWEPNGYTKITRSRKVKVADAKAPVEVDLRKASDTEKDDIVVIYVPTPDDIVEAMCKLGKVSKTDVVYDLGCGDGRMVITAVAKFDAKRGVGVEINPKLVEECKDNAKKAGVDKKVEFRQGDVLKIGDLKDADVVLLYMGDDINNRLKPILKSTLKPGSRVVSHRFRMGEWEPTKTEKVAGKNGGEYELHLWVIEGEKKK